MTKPESPRDGLTFDLTAVEEQMRQEDAYARTGHTARTLVRVPDLRVVLIVMKGGSHIAEHQAGNTASVQVVSGQAKLRLAERTVDLSSGQLLVLDRGLRHDVEATTDCALVLTLGWRDSD